MTRRDDAIEAAAAALDAAWNPDRYPIMTAMFTDYAETALDAALAVLQPTVPNAAATLHDLPVGAVIRADGAAYVHTDTWEWVETDPMTPEHLAEIEACANAATEGPWHAWDRGIGYELHLGVAAKCEPSRCEDVNGEFRETFKQADAEFIAHARTDVPALLAEVRRLQAAAEQFAVTLGFGGPEPAATLAELVEPIEQAFSEARDHFECPVICESCGEPLASQACEKCNGSGCLPNAALAYLECDECAGVGKVHPGCAERSYADLADEVHRLQDAIERVRAVHYETTWCDTDKVHGCKTCADVESVCDADSEYWPCPTIAALVFDTGSNHE